MADATVLQADDVDETRLDEIADAELPELQREAQAWLLANNGSDQRAIALFAVALGVPALAAQLWWAVVLALCILAVVPFRRMAGPHFERGDIRRGLLWANAGTWWLVFPCVAIVPDTLPIAIQNVIGPLILTAAYLGRSMMSRMVPAAIAVAVGLGLLYFLAPGTGLEDDVPRWLYVPTIIAYMVGNLLLVISDLQEVNRVRLRSLRRAVEANRELTEADQALRESRLRLLSAADTERVRLERDLHDGAQQRLVATSLRLRLAADGAAEGSPPTAEALHELHRDVGEAIEELRELARGVYPVRLAELGLAGSLRSAARRSPIPVRVSDHCATTVPDRLAVTLYFVCHEAIQNATKNAEPDTSVEVTLSCERDDLVVVIRDDGPGFVPAAAATSGGLVNMADRVHALGGTFEIDTELGRGTTISVRVPLAAGDIG